MANIDSTPSKSNDIKRLHGAIETMDALSQEGFSEIAGIARLALLALEHPDGTHHTESIAQALRVIGSKAGDIENCINVEAEQVGCNWRDQALVRRYAASRAASE